MAPKFLFTLIITLLIMACSNKESNKANDEKVLASLYAAIKSMSESVICSDGSEWRATALGAKACGGPTEYVLYSVNIDTVAFLNKVQLYTQKQRDYNAKYGAISDCMFVSPPQSIVCKNGKATAVNSYHTP
ncbi:hypothetical protein [Pelobium manganitolerans]|uniref:hypothetical protein n=1 Tax=Pelobium manganitolerans TaxID=1842495 RepID=UPI003FA35C4C